MNFSEVAMYMWPFWMLGLFMAFIAWKTDNGSLLRIEGRPLLKWIAFLVFVFFYRLFIFKYLASEETLRGVGASLSQIPWQMMFMVFWEDMTFALPLVFLNQLLGSSKLSRPIYWLGLVVMMLSFGSGHIYQGWIASLILSLYVPFSASRGQSIGFGTVVLCHMLYDLSTFMAVRLALGV